jgi:hypothetical protein
MLSRSGGNALGLMIMARLASTGRIKLRITPDSALARNTHAGRIRSPSRGEFNCSMRISNKSSRAGEQRQKRFPRLFASDFSEESGSSRDSYS